MIVVDSILRRPHVCLGPLLCALALCVHDTSLAAKPFKCPAVTSAAAAPGRVAPSSSRTRSKPPMVFAIGSSTMGSVLGKVLKRYFKKRFVARLHVWGKASTGLARPDYHDWPGQIRGINRRHKPAMFIVSLGTNDGQALFWHDGRRKRWAKLWNPTHKRIYGERVTAMLEGMAGKDRSRPIIWIGPTGHPNPKFNRRMRYLRDIVVERIKAFDGRVTFIDGLEATLDPSTGQPRARVTIPGTTKTRKALQSDDMHLNWQGARWLLAEPVLKLLRPCLRDKRRASPKSTSSPKAGAR